MPDNEPVEGRVRSRSKTPVTCPHCKQLTGRCECQLLICHTCEARDGFGKHRAIEQFDRPAVRFREIHGECARAGWGSNV